MNGSSRAVFVSYASQDAEAALRICTSLRAAGIEVWFDQNELRGGDAWDAKIRQQIKACTLFVPIISANSHGRAEGYFRLEWKLAVDRSHLMAQDKTFIVPVYIDEVHNAAARVPEKFREVQWTRLLRGEATPAFVARIGRLLADADSERSTPESHGTHETTGVEGTRIGGGASRAPARPTDGKPYWRRPRIVVSCAAALLIMAAAAAAWIFRYHLLATAAVVPYSIQDRRMTFAVVPFDGPSNDAHGVQVAQATAEAVTATLERDALFLQLASRRSVADAVRRFARSRDLARALDVHFLIGGTATRGDSDYRVELTLTDGSTEHVLQTAELSVTGDALRPRWQDDIANAAIRLVFAGMKEEAARAADKPVSQLDVRDLSFRAIAYWTTHRGTTAHSGYTTATDLLDRALALAPDDPLALYLTAGVNLCDCVMAWSHNVEQQKAIGTIAMDRFLQIDPNNVEMLGEKADILLLRGRPEDSLIVAEAILRQDPESEAGLETKVRALLRLGRAREALPLVVALRARPAGESAEVVASLAAAVRFAVGDYAAAAQLAEDATTQMSQEELRSPVVGPARLTLAAAAAELGQRDRAQAAMADFYVAVPQARTVRAIRAWMYPTTSLYGYEPLFDGLRKAGVPE